MGLQHVKFTAVLITCALLMTQTDGAPAANGPPARRPRRMTPFWRGFSMRPVGASCRDATDCSTRLCRNNRCSLRISVD
ncbi:liver-expressed antimicrobial peptide 2 [Ambystoma mexicanum]|uniref:liver-expressed antimicrobial peptide 2 n=1 Tax=Ambystoma mexicanum TaxID=8296 RepID=UPI0037E76DD7